MQGCEGEVVQGCGEGEGGEGAGGETNEERQQVVMKNNKKKVEERNVKVSSQICLFMFMLEKVFSSLHFIALIHHATRCYRSMKLKVWDDIW